MLAVRGSNVKAFMPSRRTLLLGSLSLAACEANAILRYPGAAATAPVLALEREMFDRVNRDRAERGKAPLQYAEALADIARNHAADMRQHRFFAHESPNTGNLDTRLIRWQYDAKVARENLAEAPNVQQAEDGLLKSPYHFENLMAEDVTHIGIGIVRGGVAAESNLLAVQVFAKPIILISSSDVEKRMLERIGAARGRPLRRDALLDDLASDYVESVSIAMTSQELARETKRALEALPKNSTFKGLIGIASVVYDIEDLSVAVALDPRIVAAGIGAIDAKDADGRRCHKLAALFAF